MNGTLRYALPKLVLGMKNGRRNKLDSYVCSTQIGTGDEKWEEK